jgi:hypothetical protein
VRADKIPSEHAVMPGSSDNPSLVQRSKIDPVFKQVLSFRCEQLGIPLQTEFEVSRLPRTIDAIIRLDSSKELEQIQSQTPFGHFRTHNQVEFKGRRDPLTIAEYYLILGRGYLYLGEHDVLASQMTVTIVSSRRSRRVLSRLKGVEFQSLGEGRYLRSGELAVYLIVVNELTILPTNYPLLLFASSAKKFRQFLQHVVFEKNWDYIRFAYHLRSRITKEVLTMAGINSLPKKDLEFIAKDIGVEILPYLDKADLLKQLSLEDRLMGLSHEDILRGLNVEELRKLKQLIENLEKKC